MSVAAAVHDPRPHPEKPASGPLPAAGGLHRPSGGSDLRTAESGGRQLPTAACVEPAAITAKIPATCRPAASALRQAQVQKAHRGNRAAAEAEIAAVRVELEGPQHDAVGAERPSSGKPDSSSI